MKVNSVSIQKLRTNSYQDAYLTYYSHHYQRAFNQLTKWLVYFGYRNYGGNKKTLEKYFDNISNFIGKKIPCEIPTRIFRYHYDKLPTRISMNILPQAIQNAKSIILSPHKQYHHEIEFRGFTVVDPNSQGFIIKDDGKLYICNIQKIKDRKFPRGIEFQLNQKMLKYIRETSDKFYLEFRYLQGKWFIYFMKQKEIKYKKVIKNEDLKFASIDIGLDNICLIDDINFKPILFDLKELVYENLKLFKKSSKYKSEEKYKVYRQKVKNNFKSQLKLIAIRIIQYLKNLGINRLSIGNVKSIMTKNQLSKGIRKLWNMIPFSYFKNYLKFQGNKNSISVYEISEWYTSKCSSIILEEINKHKIYEGKRITRGLFKVKDVVIHSDVNGALNILRKTIYSRLKDKTNLIEKFNKRILEHCRAISNVKRISFRQLNWLKVEFCLFLEESKDYGKQSFLEAKQLVKAMYLNNLSSSHPSKEQLFSVMHSNLVLKFLEIKLV